jgi:hypothetical protein
MKHLVVVAAGIFVALLLTTSANAFPAGVLSIDQCAGGGARLTATSIDFVPPSGGGNGCTQTSAGTNVTYTGGGPLASPGPPIQGAIVDVAFGGSFPVPDFMTFTGNPNLHFDIDFLVIPSLTTNCAGLTLNELCTIAPGSPYRVGPFETGTYWDINPWGTARDLSALNSTWHGLLGGRLNGISPVELQTILLGGGSITSPYSGFFGFIPPSQVPEPTTMLLLCSGLVGIAVKVRKRGH